MYFMRQERRGKEDFVISDAYPGGMEGMLDNGIGIPLYHIYPLSKQVVIILTSIGAELSHKAISGFDKKMLKKPILSRDGKCLYIKTQRLYNQDVRRLNQILIDNATEGIVGYKMYE